MLLAAAVVTTTVRHTSIATKMDADAAMNTATARSHTMCRGTRRTANVRSVILTRNIVIFAAKAWKIAPAGCRMLTV